MLFFGQKMHPLFFNSRSSSLLLSASSLSFAGLSPTFSFSLTFSFSTFQICGHDNYSKLNTLDNTDTETISAFVFIECFHMTSRRSYWCPQTMKWQQCWCPKLILWELNSFLTQTLSFVPINLHRCWPHE